MTLADAWLSAWTAEGAFADCCTADVGYEDPLTTVPLTGAAAIGDHAKLLREAFPDAVVTATAPMLEGGGHACIPWKLTGTHRGEVGPLPATDKEIALHGLHYVALRDGRVSRARGFFDLYEGAVQLGLLPRRGGVGEAALLLLRGFGVRGT